MHGNHTQIAQFPRKIAVRLIFQALSFIATECDKIPAAH